MNNLTVMANKDLKVTSLEIAEWTGKRHDNVMRDIRIENENLAIINELIFELVEYVDSKGEKRPCYEMSRKGVMQLALKYDAVTRYKVIEKLEELENKSQFKDLSPQTQLLMQISQSIAMSEIKARKTEHKINQIQSNIENVETKLKNSIELLTEKIEKDWKDTINAKINELCVRCNLNYRVFRGDLYAELERIANCNISTRQTRLKERMKKAGATYKEHNAITKIHVIEKDSNLKQIFEGIVNRYVLKYAE